MKVKIGDTWYQGNEVRICVLFSKYDLEVLQTMIDSECKRYCEFPDTDEASDDEIREWMVAGDGEQAVIERVDGGSFQGPICPTTASGKVEKQG